MPRPKIHDSQRRRAAEACSTCRESKKKCSGTAPCTQCQRRGLSQQCFITYLPRGFRSTKSHAGRPLRNPPPQAFAAPASARSATTVGLSSSMNMIGPQSEQDAAARKEPSGPLSPSESREGNEESIATTRMTTRGSAAKEVHLETPGPRMLLSSHGERVYIGAAASIAFLQFVRRVVAEQIGPSDFSHSKDSEKMLEIETPKPTDRAMEITAEQKLQFLQCYFSVTEAFIDIFEPQELEACITNSGQGPLVNGAEDSNQSDDGATSGAQLSILRRASLDLVVAIGAQCTSGQDSQDIGRAFFRGAQRQALSEMIQDPDLDMVRTYLLMAFYMLGECRRNTAYMYLSVAARAAIALGLHSPSSYSGGQALDADDKMRLRVWMTCRVSDKLVNSLLGRPAATVGISEELGPIFDSLMPGSDYGFDCMIAAYRIVSIIEDINTKLYNEQDIRPVVVEQLLQAIDAWKHDLPPTLKQSTPDGSLPQRSMSAERAQGSVGVVHVSCLYYFAVMLASRPVFISALALQQRDQDSHSPIGEACLDAALYLAQTCAEAFEAGLLGSNMCIMKALVFAAGLVLGVERFAKPRVNHDIDSAFEGAKRVLAFLATRSPQASHYLDILTSLSNAIAKQRSRKEPSRTSRYVSKLFSVGPSAARAGNLTDRVSDDASWSSAPLDDETMAPVSSLPNFADSPPEWPDGDQMDPDLFVDWETVNISHWDNFPFSV